MSASEDGSGFAAFFAAESPRLQRFAAWLTGDVDRAADLAQEALARTYRNWRKVRDDEPAAYARRIVVNLVRTEYRRRLVERKHAPVDEKVTAPAAVEEWLEIAAALRSLPPIRRATIVLRFYEDMSEAQIAAVLDRPLGSVKSDIHRGIKRLRQVLGDEPQAGSRASLQEGESL